MSTINIRKATLNDLEEIKNLIHLSIKELYKLIYPQGVVDFFLEYHDAKHIRINSTTGLTLVITDNDTIVATSHLIGNTIGGMYVHPQHQRKGYATRLSIALFDAAKELKLKFVELDSTLMAKPLHDKLGFETTEFLYQQMDNGDRLYYFKMRKIL